MLIEHLGSIQALFAAAAGADGFDIANKLASALISFSEWMRMVRTFNLIDKEFTVRDASLAFVWSRMRVIDDTAKRSRAKLENLSVEDFYEALIHVSMMKALPTDEEIADADAEDAGDFLIRMRAENPAGIDVWIAANAARWDSPPRQPTHRCLAHLLSLLMRTVLEHVRVNPPKPGEKLVVSQKQCRQFLSGSVMAA